MEQGSSGGAEFTHPAEVGDGELLSFLGGALEGSIFSDDFETGDASAWSAWEGV